MPNLSISATSLVNLSATEMSRLVREKQISPVALVQAHLDRIEFLNPKLNAFANVNSAKAVDDARQAEAALMHGDTDRQLLGVPVSIKSCIDVQGMKCAAGSRLREDYVAAADAALVARLKAAGAIVIGNTSTPEFLMAYHTENDLQGRTNNPWDLARTPGGSSGGEAAAIASCMSAAGIGSDGGGSIRVPAHFSGICGLKPTPGRIPATGHYPASGGPFSLIGVVGPMARTVEDLRLLFQITAGYDVEDPVSAPLSFEAMTLDAAKTLRVGFYDTDGYTSTSLETRAAVRAAATALHGAGFIVDAFRPEGLDQARDLWRVIFIQGCAMAFAPTIEGHRDKLSQNMKEFLGLAAEQPPLTGRLLLDTLLDRDQLRARFLSQMEEFPILLAPVCSIPAFLHTQAGWGQKHGADYLRTMTYCQHYNLLGNPAAVVPMGRSTEGLPIGIQVIGRPYKEDEVLAVASVLDKQFEWKGAPLL
jgi:Asp-tRNA(Asn)/Glu-tRNA(Gln) amidotransferase A subunit family amidase